MSDGMWVIGVTGRSGSGKSSVTQHYARLGYPVSDGDAISRLVTVPGSPCLAELVGAFGAGILRENGTLDRKALGKLAFSSPEKNQRLIDITHPYILDEFKRQAEAAQVQGATLFFVDGAVIIGGPVQPYCDKIIVVTSEPRLSVSRIILRDGISKTAATTRLEAQTPEADMRAAADYIIENNGSFEALKARANEVLRDIENNRKGEGQRPAGMAESTK